MLCCDEDESIVCYGVRYADGMVRIVCDLWYCSSFVQNCMLFFHCILHSRVWYMVLYSVVRDMWYIAMCIVVPCINRWHVGGCAAEQLQLLPWHPALRVITHGVTDAITNLRPTLCLAATKWVTTTTISDKIRKTAAHLILGWIYW